MAKTFHFRTGKCRKPRKCYWCGEMIEVGESLTSWRYNVSGDCGICTCHEECERAWSSAAASDWYYEECVSFGDHSRGCTCPRGDCECQKANQSNERDITLERA